jgi:hypothetical protein
MAQGSSIPWEWLSLYVHRQLVLAFDRLALFNTSNSTRVLQVSLVAVFTLATGALRMGELNEQKVEALWCPLGSLALEHKDYMDSQFGELPHAGQFMLRKSDGSDVLTEAGLATLQNLEEKVGNLGGFNDACSRVWDGGPCDHMSALQFWDGDMAAVAESFTSGDGMGVINRAGSFHVDADGLLVFPKYVLGSAVRNESTRGLLGAKAFMSYYFLSAGSSKGEEWQENFISLLKQEQTLLAGEGMVLDFTAFTALTSELNRGIMNATQLSMISCTTIAILLFCIMLPQFGQPMKKASLVRLVMIHVAAMSMILLSLPAGIGLAMLCGVKYTPITTIIIFLVLGIGVDDAVLMITSWGVTNPGMSPGHRNRETMVHSGPAVTLTSVTTVLAFVVGSTSAFPAVRHFCYSAALTLLACYILCITLFNSILVSAERSFAESSTYEVVPGKDTDGSTSGSANNSIE